MLRMISKLSGIALALIAAFAMVGAMSPSTAATTSDHSVVAKQVSKKVGSFNCSGKVYTRTTTSQTFGGGQFRWTLGAASYDDRAVIVESTNGTGANFSITDVPGNGGAYIGIGPSYGSSLCLTLRASSAGADFNARRNGNGWNSYLRFG